MCLLEQRVNSISKNEDSAGAGIDLSTCASAVAGNAKWDCAVSRDLFDARSGLVYGLACRIDQRSICTISIIIFNVPLARCTGTRTKFANCDCHTNLQFSRQLGRTDESGVRRRRSELSVRKDRPRGCDSGSPTLTPILTN